jgi:hypothetical protein
MRHVPAVSIACLKRCPAALVFGYFEPHTCTKQPTKELPVPETPQNSANATHSSSKRETESTSLEALHQLRDEIRLQVHLASMGAKDKWQELEGQLETLNLSLQHKTDTAAQIVDDARETARGAMEDLKERFELFRESIKERTGH